jgi:hypothetical protein
MTSIPTPTAADTLRCYTVSSFARRYCLTRVRVREMIRSGALKALNVSEDVRQQWRITPEAVAAFEAAREFKPKTAATKRAKPVKRRRRDAGDDEIDAMLKAK